MLQEITRLRRSTADAARAGGATLLAVALPPTVPQEFPITDKPRNHRIAEEQVIGGPFTGHVGLAEADQSAVAHPSGQAVRVMENQRGQGGVGGAEDGSVGVDQPQR